MRAFPYVVLFSFTVPVSAGLIAEWDFDAHTAFDVSENSTDYDLAGQATSPTYNGGFATFSGNADDYLQTIGPGGANNFTVSLWVRTGSADQGLYQGLFSNNYDANAAYSWQIDNHNGTYRINSTNFAAMDIGTPTTGGWDNIVLRKTNTGTDWYFNGAFVSSDINSVGGLQNFRVGINRNSGDAYGMDLDRVQVWDSAEDAAGIYSAGRYSGTPFNASVSSDLLDASNWDEGLPANSGVNSIAKVGRGLNANVTTGTGGAQFTDQLWVGFGGSSGNLDVLGGDTRIGAGSGDGIYIGVGHGSTGTVHIHDGAVLRAQGGGVRMQIGDTNGGTGSLLVEGELQNYKWFDVVDGTLTMAPTGINNSFNSNDTSYFRAAAILAFQIDGADIGTIGRANTTGLNVDIDPAAQLAITLFGNPGDYTLGQQWTLMDYTSLSGQFAQGTSFTNGQGYVFNVDYGAGSNDQMVLTLVPEPSTAMLALGGLFLFHRRRTVRSETTSDFG